MKLNSMNKRDRRALLIGVAILVPGLAIPFVVRPYLSAISSVRERTDDERDRLAREQRDIAELKTLPATRVAAADRLTKEVNRLFQATDPLIASGDFAQYVATAAQSDGLRLQQSETRPTRVLAPGVEALQIEVRAQGDLDGIMHFLQHLETGDKLIRLGAVSIEGGQQPLQMNRPNTPDNNQQLANFGGGNGGGGFGGFRRRFPGGGNPNPAPAPADGGNSVNSVNSVQFGAGGGGGTAGVNLGAITGALQQGNGVVTTSVQGDTAGLGNLLSQLGATGRRRSRRAWRNLQQAQSQREPQSESQSTPAPVEVTPPPQNQPQGEAEVLSLSATIYAYRLAKAPWVTMVTRGQGGASPFPRPPYAFESIDQIVNHDLFNATRSRPSLSFRDAMALANRPPGPPVRIARQQVNLHLVGTVVGNGVNGFAMCQNGTDAPAAVHIGESCAGYTLTSLRRGMAVFSTPDGGQIQLQAPQPGTAQ